MADIVTADEVVGAPVMGAGGPAGEASASAARMARRTNYEGLFTTKAKQLVKGAGHVMNNGVPLNEATHAGEISTKSMQAILDVRAATAEGVQRREQVLKAFSPDFMNHRSFAPIAFQAKSFTAGNLGISGIPYGLVPFDLLAPSRLIYPVYTLFRYSN